MKPFPSFYPSTTPSDRAAITIDSIGMSDMKPREHVRRRQWKSHQFMFSLSGAGVGEVLGEPFVATAGDIVILPKDRDHRYHVRPGDGGWRYLWIEFDGACVPQHLAML